MRQAVRNYNTAITYMERSGNFTDLPMRTTVTDEKAALSSSGLNRSDLNSRIKELNSFTLKYNKTGRDVVDYGGYKVPKALKENIKKDVKKINRKRANMLNEIYPDFSEMSPVQQSTALSNVNLMPESDEVVYTEKYKPSVRYSQLKDKLYPQLDSDVDEYLNVWRDNAKVSQGEVVRIVNRFLHNKPHELLIIWESGYDETQVSFIYPEYPSHPYNKIPEIVRHNRIVNFWQEQEEKYFGV